MAVITPSSEVSGARGVALFSRLPAVIMAGRIGACLIGEIQMRRRYHAMPMALAAPGAAALRNAHERRGTHDLA